MESPIATRSTGIALQGQPESYYVGLLEGLTAVFGSRDAGWDTKDGQAHIDLINPALLLKFTYASGKIEMVIGNSTEFIDITQIIDAKLKKSIQLLAKEIPSKDHYQIPKEFLGHL